MGSRRCPADLGGCFRMLPQKERAQHKIPPSIAVDDGIFDHPVVLLSRAERHELVVVLVVTSFGETAIQDRHNNRRMRQRYLPIHPAQHPDTHDLLTVAHGKELKKRSYVNIGNVYELPFSILRKYGGDDDLHLQGESYRIMVKVVWEQDLTDKTILLNHGIRPGSTPPSVPASYGTFSGPSIPAPLPLVTPTRSPDSSIPRRPPMIPAARDSVPYSPYSYVPSGSAITSTGWNTTLYSTHHGLADSHAIRISGAGDGPKRPTWLRQLFNSLTSALTSALTSERSKTCMKRAFFLILALVACWFIVALVRYAIQAVIAAGKVAWEWLTNLPSAIGKALSDWWNGKMQDAKAWINRT